MATAEPRPEQAALRDAIVNIVEASFNERRQVVLLAYIGQSLSRRGIDFKAILGEMGLAAFIRQELSDSIELVTMPDDPKVVAALPKGVELDKEIDPFGRRRRPTQSATSQQAATEHRLLVARTIWFAFSHSLSSEHTRIVHISPALGYEDVPADETTRGGYPVPREYIIPAGTLEPDERNQKIYDNIMAWAKANGIDIAVITTPHKDKDSRRSVLDVLLSSMKPSDLERVVMPLDVVNLLRMKRV